MSYDYIYIFLMTSHYSKLKHAFTRTFSCNCLQDAGTHSFSIGITEVLNTNLLLELSADDIEYVYQR